MEESESTFEKNRGGGRGLPLHCRRNSRSELQRCRRRRRRRRVQLVQQQQLQWRSCSSVELLVPLRTLHPLPFRCFIRICEVLPSVFVILSKSGFSSRLSFSSCQICHQVNLTHFWSVNIKQDMKYKHKSVKQSLA